VPSLQTGNVAGFEAF